MAAAALSGLPSLVSLEHHVSSYMRRSIFFVLVVLLLAFAYFRWNGGVLPFHWHRGQKFTPASGPTIDTKDVQFLAAMDAEYEKLVQSVVPSVVSIATARRVAVPLVDPFQFLFGQRRYVQRTETALGSGVIVSKEGHILTNHHVIANMEEIRVQLTDGRILPATLIGSDEAVDIAVLRVDAPDLTPLPLGDSDEVRVGQMVIAVGNPFGLQETVTRGIVSAKGRALPDSGVGFLQTDAAVNPGNSGGPLLNLRGEIIGINSSIYSQSGGWAGISFAIPSNLARQTLESILKTGRPIRVYIGMNQEDITPALARQLGLRETRGVLVRSVVPDSPAEHSGLKVGDVIKTFNGHDIGNGTGLRSYIAKTPIGSKVELGIIRNGKDATITTTVAEVPAGPAVTPQTVPQTPQPGQSQTAPSRPEQTNNVLAGVEVGPIPSGMRDALPQNVQGVVVTQLQPDCPAAERLRVGDVIEEINNHPVRSAADFETLSRALAATDRAVLYVARGRTRAFIVIAP